MTGAGAVPESGAPAYRVRLSHGALAASVEVPGSKSVANRALVCAALAGGTSRIERVAPGDDTAAMLDALALLGIATRRTGASSVEIDGCDGRLSAPPVTLQTRLAGTTSRFVTALAALGSEDYTIDGFAPLRERPMSPLHDALRDLGADVRADRPGHLPVVVRGPVRGGSVSIRGDVSSQYLTALMLVGPYLDGGLRIELTTPLVSRSYLGITAAVMTAFGVSGVEVGEHSVLVPPGHYQPVAYAVEPDASSASYPLAAAAICGGTVHVPGLTDASLQGDAAFAGLLEAMGCEVRVTGAGTSVTRDGPLRGIDVDMVDLSDLVPTLAVVAPFAHTPTVIRGVGFIRHKESDRIGDLCTELRRLGVDARELDDGLEIRPGHPHAARVDTHHDHRLAMSLALIGLVLDGVEVADPAVVSKSWPGYWDMLEELV